MTEANPEKEKMPAPEIRETDSGEKGQTDNGAGIDPLLAKENRSFFREVNIEFLVHELKDPVSIIETGVRLLIEKANPSAPLSRVQERTLARILRNACKTREMLNELLEVGRAESECFNPQRFNPITSLQKVLFEVIERDAPDLYEEIKQMPRISEGVSILSKNGIRVDIAPSAKDETILQDETKFSQIISNLIKNGLYYRRRQLLVHLSYQREQLSVAIRDDGPGIAAEHHEEIFERYKQVIASAEVARSGHGLGLAVARILARSMGGDITIDSELGNGALFKFVLPIAPPF